MRLFIQTLSALAVIGTMSVTAQAAEQRKPTPVTIAPRFLSAGTAVPPSDYRGAVSYADARFIPTSRDYNGRDAQYQIDPWYVPGKRGMSVDFGMFSSKRPGEH